LPARLQMYNICTYQNRILTAVLERCVQVLPS
jgi:hypothetical protein